MAKYTDVEITKDPRAFTGTGVKACGVEHKLGFGMVTLRCSRKAGHDGSHRSHGVHWDAAAPIAPPDDVREIVLKANDRGEVSAREAPLCGRRWAGGGTRICVLPRGHREDYHWDAGWDFKWVDNPVQATQDAPMPPPPSPASLQEVEVVAAAYDDKPLWDKIDAPAPPPPKVTEGVILPDDENLITAEIARNTLTRVTDVEVGVDPGAPGGDRTVTTEIVLSPRNTLAHRGDAPIEQVVEAEVVTETQYESARQEQVLKNQNPYAGRMLITGTDFNTRLKKELYDQWCRDQQMQGRRVLTNDGRVLQPVKKR